MNNYSKFIHALQQKKIINITFNSNDKGVITRKCIPFDFGPSRRKMEQNPDRFHLYDLSGPEGQHTLSILPEQIISVEILEESFDPASYVSWTPNWFFPRDWGTYS